LEVVPMKTHALPLFSAAALGFAAAVVCSSLWLPKPASAQFKGAPAGIGQPLGGGLQIAGGSGTATNPQPLAIQALDGEHFVVVSREPRLVTQIGHEGSAQNMLVTVVTHYTVRGDRLLPIERVQTPTGYHVVTIESEN
jgi:hypothetical protein